MFAAQGAQTVNVAATAERPIMSERRVSLFGALFVALGPVSMALYMPAMPEIASAFSTTQVNVKLTLTLYFGGFAFAQLIAGPLSDALGRRPVTFAFLAVYLIASLACLFAPNIETLIIARFFQGVGASAGIAIARALVRDLYTGDRSSRIMNMIGIILALGPALSPTIGGYLVVVSGWRIIFATMVLLGLTVFFVALVGLRETVRADHSRLNIPNLLTSYRDLLTNRHFLVTATIIGGSMGAMYAQVTFLPFILMNEVGLSPTEFGFAMLIQSGSFFFGSLIVRYLMRRISAYRMVLPGLIFVQIGSLILLSLLFVAPSLLGVMIPAAFLAFGIAFIMPAISTAALAPFPHIAGAASAMMGFIQMGSGFAVGSIGALFGDPVLALATLIPAMAATALVAYRVYLRHPHIAEPEPRGNVISGPPVGRTHLPNE
jgi:MFS transporter, DHA1 family, multidrug resistance protein